MPELQSIQSYLPPPIELPTTANVVFTPNRNYQATLPTLVGSIAVTHKQVEYLLIAVGEYHARQLVKVLGALRPLNEDAIYSITSILEPYMEATEELDLHMPPLSSRKVTINVTDRGRAKPDLYIE